MNKKLSEKILKHCNVTPEELQADIDDMENFIKYMRSDLKEMSEAIGDKIENGTRFFTKKLYGIIGWSTLAAGTLVKRFEEWFEEDGSLELLKCEAPEYLVEAMGLKKEQAPWQDGHE